MHYLIFKNPTSHQNIKDYKLLKLNSLAGTQTRAVSVVVPITVGVCAASASVSHPPQTTSDTVRYKDNQISVHS